MSEPLPSAVRRLVVAEGLWGLGTGMVLPLTLIYLHRVRHIGLGTTGLLLGLSGLVGLAALPLVGVLSDRFGAARLLPVLAGGMAVSEAAMAWAHNPLTAVLPITVAGLAQGSSFTVFSALLAELCPEQELQRRAFAVNFTALNGALGAGSLVSAAVVNVHHPGTFQALYLAAAGGDVLFGLVLLSIHARVPAAHPHRHADGAAPGYRQLLRRPGMGLVVGLALLLALCGYAAVDSGVPAYGNVVSRVSPRVIALGVSVNTAVIVVVQLFVLRLVRGRRASRWLAGLGVVWAACWLLLGLSRLPRTSAVRSGMVLAFAGLFGVGETLMQPILGPLVNALAGEQLRGRANALTGGTVALAFVVSPALAGAAVGTGLGGVWIGYLMVCALGASVMALLLGRRLGAARDRGASEGEVLLMPTEVTATA